MFSGFDSNKKREKSRKDPVIGLGGQDKPGTSPKGAITKGQDPREMGGVTIQEYSKAQRIPEPEAWRMLRRGDIVGRTHEGRLYVFTNVQEVTPDHIHSELSPTINELLADDPVPAEFESPVEAELHAAETLKADSIGQAENIENSSYSHDPLVGATLSSSFEETDLPPLPGAEYSAADFPRSGGTSATSSEVLPVPAERVTNTELALLLDHLSLAKEENREILKMTQESIRKVTELTETIVEMKDSVIEAKDTQIMYLKDQLDGREKEIRKLLQQKEDLEILAQTIMATQQPAPKK